MKNKKFRFVIVKVLILILISISTVTVVFWNMKNTNNVKTDQVTITFETNGGNQVKSIKLDKGEKLSNLPQSYLAGSYFDGWYIDKNLTEEFKLNTEVNKDMTLYAGYTQTYVDLNLTETTSQYIENVEQNHSVKIKTKKTYSQKDFLNALTIEAVTGYLPWDMADELLDGLPKDIYGWYEVDKNGLIYTLTPKAIKYNGKTYYAYSEGQLYKIKIPTEMQFDGFEKSIVEYTFRINEEKKDTVTDNVKYKDKENIRFIKKTDIKNINEITKTTTEVSIGKVETTTTSIIKNENGYYNFIFTEQIFNKYSFKENDVLCIGNGIQLDSDSLFVKVNKIIGNSITPTPDGETKDYLILASDVEIQDVFDQIDINYNKPISSSDIIANLDTEEITKTIKTNGSVNKVTNLMTNLLFVSDEVQDIYNTNNSNNLATTYSNSSLPAFCTNTSITDEKTLLNVKLLENAKVTISVGTGHNPNFDKAYTDEFVALKITFSYETTIKDRLEINSEIVFTQYLAASAQGYLNYDFGIIKLKWAEFDAAINLYSQTDFDFKILVRTVKPDDNKKDDKENPFVNIADKIAEKLKSEEGDDPDNLIAELKEMLDSKSGYLELFKAPILRIPIDIIPGLPIMRVTVELDFLIEMNFAAGFTAHMSVLEAIQVGVTGDTRKKTVSSYQHDNLPGGNQYALQLSTCGYLGFRAGFKGGLSIGFCGLSSLGNVGVYIFAGPYVDIYGFAQATLTKTKNVVSQSLVGGYYIEIGIFLDITLEARSDMFGTKVGTSLFNKKWPLVSFGNKEVLVSIENKELEETIYIENKGEDTASISIDKLPKLNGTYIDITTGKTKTKEVPWEKVGLKVSSYNFTYDYGTKTILYKNLNSNKLVSEDCIATYYYNGPILQFNLSSDKYKDLYPFAKTKIVYYDSTKIDKENAGKTVSVKFYSYVDGKKELLEEQQVKTGTIIYDYKTLDPYKYDNIAWDKIPWQTPITSDTEFICTGELRQVYIAFIYFDAENDAWITEIRACNLDEMPIAPLVKNSNKLTFKGWYGYNGINNKSQNTPSYGIGQAITVDSMWQRGYYIESTTRKDVTKSIVTYSHPRANGYDLFYELTKENNKSEKGTMWYSAVSSIYVADYDKQDCKLTINSTDASGNIHQDTFDVTYGRAPTTYITYSPLTQKFVGFALEEDGEVVYKEITDIEELTSDLELFAKYEKQIHQINLYYYNSDINDYELYKTTNLDGGKTVGELDNDLEEVKKALKVEEGVTYQFLWFVDIKNNEKSYLPLDAICVRPLDIYPIYERTVELTFNSGEGVFPDDTDPNKTKIVLTAESKLKYKIDTVIACVKGLNDPKYKYTFIGWKNETTKEKILFKDPKDMRITLTCDEPTTFTALFEKEERNDYNITISTEYSTLKDGSKEIKKSNITYEEYIKLINEYETYSPENYRDDENHCTYISNGRTTYEDYKQTTYTISFMWEKEIDRHELIIDINGGTYDGITMYKKIEWNTEIDLSQITSTKEDDYGTWKMKNWTDTFGNTYSLNDKYYVLGDDRLTLNWEIVSYKEYTITFYLDGKNIETRTYHKDDLIENIDKPIQADGKVFSGWEWYNEMYDKIESLTQMPSENLYLIATTKDVYIIYVLDGLEISKEIGKVDYEENVKENYTKEGYTITPWDTTDVQIKYNKFIMPTKDVTFTATSTINSYTITYYHNNEIYGEILTAKYNEYVKLPKITTNEGLYYAWISEDVLLNDIGFYMPAKDIIITSISSEKTKYILYYVNGEIIDYDIVIPGQHITIKDEPISKKYEGMLFSGWYIENEETKDKQTFTIGNENIYLYGYFTKGTTKVNIYFDEQNQLPDLVLYGNKDEIITLDIKMNKKEISGYKINNEIVSNITINDEQEINVYIQYGDKKYLVKYDGYGFTLPENALHYPKEKVEVGMLPENEEYYEVEGWFSAEVEIFNENGKFYFIMPENNVTINLKYKVKSTITESYNVASVYINSPYSKEPVFYKDYIIENNNIPVYFDVPLIEGYEFIGWVDDNGGFAHDYQGVTYEDMEGMNKNFYGEYRKLELHIVEFRINNQTIAYYEFYDSYEVQIPEPQITLNEGEVFSGWKNTFVKPFSRDNIILFYTGERHTHELARQDFIFNGYIYHEENAYLLSILFPNEEDVTMYEFLVNENSIIRFDKSENEMTYELIVSYMLNDQEYLETIVMDVITYENEEVLLTIPNILELSNELKINSEDKITIDSFTLKISEKSNSDSID